MEDVIKRTLSREYEPIERDQTLEKKKIGIVSISQGAGASFLTMCLAKALANRKSCNPAVVELGRNNIYDSMGMDKHFVGRDFFRFYEMLYKGHSIKGKKNIDEGINWVIRAPKENDIILDAYEKLMLVNGAIGNYILCDFSGCSLQENIVKDTLRLIKAMDCILVVIDPMPSKMLSGYKILQEIKLLDEKERPVIYVINKFNRGVNKRELRGFLKVRNPVILPLIQAELLYNGEYNCKNPYSYSEVKTMLDKPLQQMLSILSEQL